MLKLNLEGQGIPAFLANENTGSLNFVSHTDLFVRAKDWVCAEQALSKIETFPRPARKFDPDGDEISCNHCGSGRVRPFAGDVPMLVPLIGIKAGPDDGWFHCLECDSYYSNRRSRFASMPIAFAWSAFMAALAFGLIWFINWFSYL